MKSCPHVPLTLTHMEARCDLVLFTDAKGNLDSLASPRHALLCESMRVGHGCVTSHGYVMDLWMLEERGFKLCCPQALNLHEV
eukprot:CAMPEP_0174311498 /NCGR_PEP_ID=MMETSP0810-20121108/3740_1 /TAXON_ID=73025 ORGANISM="Eutreptiella gymnastica-like, Strain CCMP1594" /NCGR_SAMPLE_ID=MMETSP0810 /ASSEMBLY_ACC=CAM_ASM_000659 /LENGTH=82 /DNA_ID=CAMNT_0015419731 /DNA_START=586 /DNA_END=835 /DNA_ORIENTATION=-